MSDKKQTAPGRAMIVRLAVLAVIAGAIYFAHTRIEQTALFTVKTFKVSGNYILDDSEVLELSGLHPETPIGGIDLNTTAARIRRSPFVKDCRVSRVYPASIRIDVMERKPVAFLNLDELYAVDSAGVLLPHLRPKQIYNFPVISGIRNVNLDFGRKVVSSKLDTALRMIGLMKQHDESLYYDISEIHFSADGPPRLFLTANAIPVTFGESDFDDKLFKLSVFLKHAKKTGKLESVGTLDLRFERRVIVKRSS